MKAPWNAERNWPLHQNWRAVAANSLGEYVRSAEKFIASQKLDVALDQLRAAQQLDPRNAYIQAIIDRVVDLQQTNSTRSEGPKDSRSQTQVQKGDDVLDLTSYPMSSSETQKHVRRFTSLADRLIENGETQIAFESLMKAYLLDPTNPLVLACERQVLPAWEVRQSQKQRLSQAPNGISSSERISKERSTMASFTPEGNHIVSQDRNQQSAGTSRNSEETRVRQLRESKEKERTEHERAIWLNASKPPKIFGEEDFLKAQEPLPKEEQKQEKGFFWKLKRGKFLG